MSDRHRCARWPPEPVVLPTPRRAILGGGSIALLLGLWEAAWQAKMISPLFFSGPSAIAKQAHYAWTQGNLKGDLLYSGTNFTLGFIGAAIAGVVIGILVGWYRRLRMIADPLAERALRNAARRHDPTDFDVVRHRHVVEGVHYIHLGLLPGAGEHRSAGCAPSIAICCAPRGRSAHRTGRSSRPSRSRARCRSFLPASAKA